ncbi:hypothetical protein OBBRIDRAFT_798047 [Obba rivulosa]|uniref:Zn(2)-C6 fungal-type domain-containing protein n=1 Tax=Obba rivulosa TaxID=1052685 RepID=A0A8E2AP45_9APHY|nr:hypothetical protein OBBRIDRAFT_798047 [Obba rivulosa]
MEASQNPDGTRTRCQRCKDKGLKCVYAKGRAKPGEGQKRQQSKGKFAEATEATEATEVTGVTETTEATEDEVTDATEATEAAEDSEQ